MDQTCPVVHKSRRSQAWLKTVTLFYIHCGQALAQATIFCAHQTFRFARQELFLPIYKRLLNAFLSPLRPSQKHAASAPLQDHWVEYYNRT
jgi:hypothetical protein